MNILIVSNNFFNAEGTIAKGIVTALPECNIFFFSVTEFKYRKNEFEKIIKKVDVVHWLVNVAYLDEDAFNIFRNINLPQVATVHHVCPGELIKIEKSSYATTIHVVSTEWKDFIQSRTRTSIVLAPLGINVEDFRNINTKLFNKGEFRIGMMGFYPGKDNRKRFDLAIEIFKSLIIQKIEFRLVLQGGGWEKFFEKFDLLKIPYEHFKFTDQKKALHFFERIHVYLCTSDYEGGPFPVLESLASGIPVVSTNIGISRDSISLGGGVLCEKGDIEALTKTLIELKNEKFKYLSLASETKNVALNFQWNKLGLSYYSMYEKTYEEWANLKRETFGFNKTSINAFKQRKIELSYDKLHETIRLMYHGDLHKGFIMGFLLLLDRNVKFNRKWSLMKTMLSLKIRNKLKYEKNSRINYRNT